MYQTIQVSTCVSAQGELVENLPNGDAVVRDGGQVYRGRPIAPFARQVSTEHNLGTLTRAREEG